ncbi:MAG: hypothetical protein ABR527_09610 [Gemmatimonadota bacterium]
MADVRDPSVPPSPDPAAGPPPKKTMSTGAKVAIGCGILAVLAIVILVIMTVAGGMFLKKKAGDVTGGLEAQQQASERVQALERDHPFTAPPDGVVGEDRAETFIAVTDDAWEAMRESMEEVVERGEEIEEEGGAAGFGDAMAGLQALGQSRVALAEALDEHDMPVSEYVWSGLALMRAYEVLETPTAQVGVPPQNLELANRYRDELADIAEEDEDGRPDKSVVLGMAWTWGMSEGMLPETMGWDTLGQYAPSQ